MDRLSETIAFLRVVETGSMTAAARQLALTPSAVSRQVARLEQRLGAQLLLRTTRRVAATDVGRAFYERCRQALADLEEAEDAVHAAQERPRGRLRLDVPVAFGEEVIAPLLPDYIARFPEIRLHVSYNDRLVDLVGEGIDLSIRIATLGDSSLIARRLARNRRVIVGSPGYFEARGLPTVPDDLTRHDCLLQMVTGALRDSWRFEGPSGPHWVQVGGRVQTESVRAIRALAIGGVGLALMPTYLVGPDLADGRLIAVLGDHLDFDTEIHAVYPPARHLSPKVRTLVDFLVARIGTPEHPPWDRGRRQA